MSHPAADRNLLFGILAVQMDFVSRDALIAAMHAWVLDKGRPLGHILRDQGRLADDELALLDGLVRKHLEKHGNDPERSLAAVGSTDPVSQDLRQVADADVQASLAHATAGPTDPDPYATSGYVPPATLPPHARFRILRPHAKGGLGEVFVALDEELKREVALKEIQNKHADHPHSRARFLLEAEITGGLEHPGIVPVYGLGTYPDGRPFYAMRFIHGDDLKEAIARFHQEKESLPAGERELRLRQLLGRFTDVCNAIAYAHSRGILHRDLKPGNVMLGKYGETLVVDWGLAKVMGRVGGLSGGDEPTLRPTSGSNAGETQAGTAVGTPAYMSPEQAAGRLDELGPASDVYSLGATLYCLLTGQPPVAERDVAEVLRKVQKGDIPPPRQVRHDVPRALDAVCRKAMALRPGDRYATALDLARDVERFLADEPVSAWREPWAVRGRRWLARRRTLVTTVAAALVVAVVSLAVASALLAGKNRDLEAARQRERQAREQTRANFALARQTVEDYTGKVNDNLRLRSEDLSGVRKELLQAVVEFHEKIKDQAGDDPAARYDRARALVQLGILKREIASPEESAHDFEQARAVLAELSDADPDNLDYQEELANCHSNLGLLYHDLGRFEEAEAADRLGLGLRRRLTEARPGTPKYAGALAASHNNLGVLLRAEGRFQESEAEQRRALDLRRQLADAHPDVGDYQLYLSDSLHNLGHLDGDLGRLADADRAYRQALDIRRRLVARHPRVPLYRSRLADVLNSQGEFLAGMGRGNDAVHAYQEALRIGKQLVADYPSVTQYQEAVADCYLSLGNYYQSQAPLGPQPEKALEHYRQALDLRTRLNQTYPGVASYQRGLARVCNSLGKLYYHTKQPAEAEEKDLQAVRLCKELAEAHPGMAGYQDDLAASYNNLGNLLADTGRHAQAEEAYQAARAIQERLAGDHPAHLRFGWNRANTCQNLGRLRIHEKKPADALEWFNRAAPVLEEIVRKEPLLRGARIDLQRTYSNRAEALAELGRHDEALADFDRYVDLAPGLEKPGARLMRARPLALAGQHARAAAEVKDVLPWLITAGPWVVYDGARVHALAAAAARNDPRLPSEERQPLAEKYAAQAVELLTRARAAGYFKAPAHVEDLKNNPDFAALGGRDDFRKLVREVEQGPRAR